MKWAPGPDAHQIETKLTIIGTPQGRIYQGEQKATNIMIHRDDAVKSSDIKSARQIK